MNTYKVPITWREYGTTPISQMIQNIWKIRWRLTTTTSRRFRDIKNL
jgi:hypothetical protein